MASVKSVNITNLDASPSVMIDSNNSSSPIMVWHDTYEASSLGSGSDITIGRIPAGASIHDVILKCDALGGSSTLKVGDSGDDDRYLAAVGTWNAAGQVQSMLGGSTAASKFCNRSKNYYWWCCHHRYNLFLGALFNINIMGAF